LNLVTHPRGAYNLLVGRKVYPSLASIRWFSVTPYALGPEQVKYAALPCGLEVDYARPGTEPIYLRQRLRDKLDPTYKGHLCLRFMVQARSDLNQPLENALVGWNSPWQSVATIDIYPQRFTSYAQDAFCERLTFNPWNGLKDHKPLGGINRASKHVMHALQQVRLEQNHLAPFGPNELTGNEDFN
jgi:hypothetical protein